MVVALRLARQGYGGGDPERVLQMRADMVIAANQYEGFLIDLDLTFVELNRDK